MLPDQYKSNTIQYHALLFRNLGLVMSSWVEISSWCLVKVPVLQVIQQMERALTCTFLLV